MPDCNAPNKCNNNNKNYKKLYRNKNMKQMSKLKTELQKNASYEDTANVTSGITHVAKKSEN